MYWVEVIVVDSKHASTTARGSASSVQFPAITGDYISFAVALAHLALRDFFVVLVVCTSFNGIITKVIREKEMNSQKVFKHT